MFKVEAFESELLAECVGRKWTRLERRATSGATSNNVFLCPGPITSRFLAVTLFLAYYDVSSFLPPRPSILIFLFWKQPVMTEIMIRNKSILIYIVHVCYLGPLVD